MKVYVATAFMVGCWPVALIRDVSASDAVHQAGWVLLVLFQMAILWLRRRLVRNTGLWVSGDVVGRRSFGSFVGVRGASPTYYVATQKVGNKQLMARGSGGSAMGFMGIRRDVGPLPELLESENRLLVREWSDGRPGPWQPTGITWGDDDDTFPGQLAADIERRVASTDSNVESNRADCPIDGSVDVRSE